MDAQLSYFFKIPFPERLDEYDWLRKYKQLVWIRAELKEQIDNADETE